MPPPISSALLVPHAYTFPPSPGSHQHPAGTRYWLEKEWPQSKFHPEKFHSEFCFMPHNSVLSTFPFLFHLLNSPLIYAPRRFLKSRSYFALDAKHCCKEGKKKEKLIHTQTRNRDTFTYRNVRNRGLITKRVIKIDSRARSIKKFERVGQGEGGNERNFYARVVSVARPLLTFPERSRASGDRSESCCHRDY